MQAAIQAAAAANSIAIPSHQPYKDAESILSDVNQRLSGRQTASVDTIARRLRPRSSRTRRKWLSVLQERGEGSGAFFKSAQRLLAKHSLHAG